MPDDSAGLDLGASRIDLVVLGGSDGARRVRHHATFDAHEIDAVVAAVGDIEAIAIDAPAELSTAPHRDDEAVNRKFRVARCGEIALGEQARIWVPWVTPADPDAVAPWMAVGFALWSALRAGGREPVEVYPAGVFRVLAGTRLPTKTSGAGRRARIGVLARHVELPTGIDRWSHDGIDALAAALTAHHVAAGTATRHAHEGAGCDGSAVWLPPAP